MNKRAIVSTRVAIRQFAQQLRKLLARRNVRRRKLGRRR